MVCRSHRMGRPIDGDKCLSMLEVAVEEPRSMQLKEIAIEDTSRAG